MSDVLDGVLGFEPLLDWMSDDGVTQSALAASLGRTQQAISGWCNRKARPSEERDRVALETLSGGRVRRDMWLNAREREPVVIRPLEKSGTDD